MRVTYVVHIVAGSVALLSGYVALFAAKGRAVHRKAGMVFFGSMLVVATFGTIIAATGGVAPAVNIPAALTVVYLVVTALTTVRPVLRAARELHVGGMLLALATSLTSLSFAFEAVAAGGTRNGMPAFPFFLFGGVLLVAAVGDVRVMRTGDLQGASRLARHLWRMCFALFVAALSFFIGQADEIPEPLRIMPLLALPVLTVIVAMSYWLWRIRFRRSVRGLVFRTPGVALGSESGL